MSQEITTKKLSALSAEERKQMIPELDISFAVVEALPASIADGKILLYKGKLWRGLLEGESSLAAGTPIPVAGFYEIFFNHINFAPVFSDFDNVTVTSTDSDIYVSVNNPAFVGAPVFGFINTGRIDGPGSAAILRGMSYTYADENLGINFRLNNLSGAQLLASTLGVSLKNFNGSCLFRIYPPAP